MSDYTLHVVGQAYLPSRREPAGCAYSTLIASFCRMMAREGVKVVHYGCEGSEVGGAEHVTVLSEEERAGFFGKIDAQALYRPRFRIDDPAWIAHNGRASWLIGKAAYDGDIVGYSAGSAEAPIAKHLGRRVFNTEIIIGHRGAFAEYRVYPSYAWAHVYAGREDDPDGKYYDTVIPHWFDADMFPSPESVVEEHDDYLLFMARVIPRKGLLIAVEVARALNCRLLVCGAGGSSPRPGALIEAGKNLYEHPGLEYLGFVDHRRRVELFSRARAFLAPTIYHEPFGLTAIEAQACGCPVVATDWGAFTETVEPGVSGFRARTLKQFVDGVKLCEALSRRQIAERAHRKYESAVVAPMYVSYFETLQTLRGKGWYTL